MIKTYCTGFNGEIGQQLQAWMRERSLPILALHELENHPRNENSRILHLAGKAPPSSTDEILDANIQFLRKVIQLAEEKRVNEFVFMSTNSLYDNFDQDLVNESINTIISPTIYTLTKKMGEEILKQSKIPKTLVLRIPGFLEVSKASNFISNISAKLLSDEDIEIRNGNRPFNNFLSVEDLGPFLRSLVLSKQFDILNLASSMDMSLMEVVKVLSLKLQSKSNISDLGSQKPFFAIDCQKARSNYSFSPKPTYKILTQWASSLLERQSKEQL